MTVLHSRNADAADPADVAAADAAADVKDPQDAAEPDLREDLGRYAELGAFTLSADTHAWYAAVDTVATPEDARAASTVLAELRGRDLQQLWETVTALVAEVKIDEPATVATTAALVETLQRVRTTSATLTPAAYDTDLGPLVAATADSAWRKERDVKLSWLRGRSLRKQAAALAHDRRIRREDLHEALASALVERRAWSLLAPAGTLPSVPADGALVDTTAQAFEALGAGVAELARLLPGHDVDGIAFAELIELVERLAADEGTLYRLPTIRGLRATLEEAGLGDLLTELTAARADRRAAEAAYAARQALAGGQRDGLAEAAPAVEAAADADVELTEETPAEPEAAEADVEAVATVETVEDEETPAASVSLPAPSPAADDLVAAAVVAAPAETAVVDEEPAAPVGAEVEAETEPEAVEAEVEAEVEAVAEEPEAPVVVETEPEAVEEPTAQPEAAVEVEEPIAAPEPVVEAEPVTEVEAVVEPVAEEPEAVVEAEAPTVQPEPVVEAEPVAAEVEDPIEEAVEEPEAVVEAEAPTAAPEPVVEPEAVVEPEVVEEPAAQPEDVVEAEPVAAEVEVPAEVAAAPEVVEEAPAAAEAPAEDTGGRPAKPDFTPGRPVTAYSAEELLSIVRWIDGDGVGRTEEELLRAAMKELGFARLGPRIKEALGAAVTAARG